MFFWKKKTPDWIKNLENQDWLEEHFGLVMDFYGEEQFVRKAPIVLSGDFARIQEEEPERLPLALTQELASQARIDVFDFKVDTFAKKNTSDILTELGIPFSSQSEAGAAGIFHNIKNGTAHIALEERYLDDDISLVGTISHELAHVFLHLKRPPAGEIWDLEDEEPLTDLVAIMLGYGVYICNSVERFKKYTDGMMSGWSTGIQGYLSLEECCYVQGLVSAVYEQRFKSYKKSLSLNPRKFVSEAYDYIKRERLAPANS